MGICSKTARAELKPIDGGGLLEKKLDIYLMIVIKFDRLLNFVWIFTQNCYEYTYKKLKLCKYNFKKYLL